LKGDKKGFYKYFSSRRKTRKIVGPLPSGTGDLVIKDTEKAKELCPPSQSLLVRMVFRNPRSLRPVVKSGAERLALGGRGSG